MNLSLSPNRNESTRSFDRHLLERVLTGVGIPSSSIDLDKWSIPPNGDVLAQVKENAQYDQALTAAVDELESRRISIHRQWPPQAEFGQADGLFVVIGGPAANSYTTAVSSRLGRALDQQPEWFDALRTFCVQMKSESGLLVAPRQYTYRFLRRLAELFAIRLTVLLQTTAEDFEEKLRPTLEMRKSDSVLEPTYVLRVVESDEEIFPDDVCVAEFCRELRAIYLRPNGNIHRLLEARLAKASNGAACRTMVLTSKNASCPKHLAALYEQGAIAWHVVNPPTDATFRFSAEDALHPGAFVKTLRLEDIDATKYVAHYTRRQRGAWLDESAAKYLDSLLLGESNRHRGALATLQRIVVQQQLIADNRLTRDESRVVCFTNRPLTDFRRLRFFRSHLARWDFEPYGIAIERDVLAALGGHPVVYGDDSVWEQLDSSKRPFFQRRAGARTDWSIEAEWRIVGDLDLRLLGEEDAIAFVATHDDARHLASFCRWPVVVLND